MASDQKTHFGYQTVDWDDKEKKVSAVFHQVARRYDLMNDLMSLGIHRLWKRMAVHLSHIRPGHCVLDLAGGSGDLTKRIYQKIGSTGQVVLADINAAMIQVGRDRLLNEGYCDRVQYVQANAEALPFADHCFHAMTMGFGLRNVTDKNQALRELYRVCKPGGQLLILEFSKLTCSALKPLYDAYSFRILPQLGAWFAHDRESYQYLAESIRMHPDQETLKTMIEAAGFEQCHYHHWTGGIVALHIAYKY